MKTTAKLLVFATLALSFSLSAQKKKPEFVKVGSMIKAVYYHENGSIAQMGCFNLKGKLQGEWVMFAQDGSKISIGSYENGKRNGNWFYWKPNGEMLREVSYTNGRLVSLVEWTNSNLAL